MQLGHCHQSALSSPDVNIHKCVPQGNNHSVQACGAQDR